MQFFHLHRCFSDISPRLIEWLELLRELGAAKVFIYYMDIHENIRYDRSGRMECRKGGKINRISKFHRPA